MTETTDRRRVLVLAHEGFPDRAKTAVGLLRYGPHEVVGVLDREIAESSPDARVSDYLDDVPDAPILGRADEADAFDTLVVGVAPIGGGFDRSWRPDVRRAIESGADVWAGLHYLLNEDEEFARLAAEHDVDLWDVREPPADLTVSDGEAGDVDATVVLTVGSDCSTGKMTTTMELYEAARDRGWDAGFVPTGQTGVMVAGDGIVVDRTISDFTAGATERGVLAAADHDYVFVEGQGAITHPAYSGVTCGILHGAMPDAMVLCHEAGREAVHGYESFPLAAPETLVSLYEDLARPVHEGRVVAGALNTHHLDEAAAHDAVEGFADSAGVPTTDPVRFGVGEVLDAL
ncbi:DUF1611 domain-containing protein [Salinirubellus salinus]|uniref:DUF1611 domain-containing protein n=1 Tax=Salinirubellus salinus TaxID=1364945 RepID=A0A9E7UCA7_9EURY|nr:DUF1611 domain-containing protein [Salinirubellus salinus]UWM55594.1 DUF1611 domain-containing protein [Salinirubellus salinus]